MIQIDNITIYANVIDIIKLLKAEKAKQGISIFQDIKNNDNSNSIQLTCPFHKEGKERKPSFGIDKEKGICHCFTCDWKGNIFKLVSELLGYNDSEIGKKWLISKFNSEISQSRQIALTKRKYNNIIQKSIKYYVSEQELASYRYIVPYMYERHLTNEIIEKFDIGYDKKTNSITVPYKNINGQVEYIGRRVAMKGEQYKSFNYPQGINKILYGAYEIVKNNIKECWVVESVFNCLTCWKYNIPCVALSGKGSDNIYKQLNNLPVRSYILALDPDEAGRKGQSILRNKLQGKLIKEIIYNKEDGNKDINDLDNKILQLKISY